MSNTSAPILARRWGVYAQPKTNEERIISALERAFPGSHWEEPAVLEMVCIGPGPGPKNVLGSDGVVYPYGRFKHLKGQPLPILPLKNPPLPASTAPKSESGSSTTDGGTTSFAEGAGEVLSHRLSMLAVLDRALAFGRLEQKGKTPPAPGDLFDYGVIGGEKYDAGGLEDWVISIAPASTIVSGSGRGAEQVLRELSPGTVELPKRKDFYGGDANLCQVEDVLSRARTVVLVGKGSRVDAARSWLNRFGEKYRPPVIEIGAK